MRERGVQHQSWGPFADSRKNLFADPTLSEIGARYGKSVARVVLGWLNNATWSSSGSLSARKHGAEPRRLGLRAHRRGVTRIAARDTGASLFFDHPDPAMVSQFGNVASTPDQIALQRPCTEDVRVDLGAVAADGAAHGPLTLPPSRAAHAARGTVQPSRGRS